MADITLRQVKGSKLTHAELDGNFAEKVTQVAHGCAVADLVYFNGTTWAKATNAAAASLAQGYVHAAPDADTLYIVTTDGVLLTKAGHGLGGAGTKVYCDTAGAMTATAPSGFRQQVGVVHDANRVRFRIFPYEEV